MNAHMGNDEQGIEGNNEKIGINGKEYRRFIKENELILCNNSNKCKGRWTRIDGESKSILDLTIATTEAFESMVSMEIDEEEWKTGNQKPPPEESKTEEDTQKDMRKSSTELHRGNSETKDHCHFTFVRLTVPDKNRYSITLKTL